MAVEVYYGKVWVVFPVVGRRFYSRESNFHDDETSGFCHIDRWAWLVGRWWLIVEIIGEEVVEV